MILKSFLIWGIVLLCLLAASFCHTLSCGTGILLSIGMFVPLGAGRASKCSEMVSLFSVYRGVHPNLLGVQLCDQAGPFSASRSGETQQDLAGLLTAHSHPRAPVAFSVISTEHLDPSRRCAAWTEVLGGWDTAYLPHSPLLASGRRTSASGSDRASVRAVGPGGTSAYREVGSAPYRPVFHFPTPFSSGWAGQGR